MVSGDIIAFILISAATLGAGLATVLSRRLFTAALFLAATLFGVGGLFLMLNAQFLFAVQLLVYVGAIVTLILFAIMFTHGSTKEEEANA